MDKSATVASRKHKDATAMEDDSNTSKTIDGQRKDPPPSSTASASEAATGTEQVNAANSPTNNPEQTQQAQQAQQTQQDESATADATVKPQQSQTPQKSQQPSITLADVIGASAEMEADSVVISNLDDVMQTSTPQARAEEQLQTLLSHVPPDVSSNFLAAAEEEMKVSEDDIVAAAAAAADVTVPTPKPKQLFRTTSTASSPRLAPPTIIRNPGYSERSPLPSTFAPTPPPEFPSSPKQHRRQLTVEQNLFGLTSALSAMDHIDGRGSNRQNDNDISSSVGNPLGGSGDRLLHTVNLMFNTRKRINKKDETTTTTNQTNVAANNGGGSVALPPSTAGSTRAPAKKNWAHLRNNMDIYKKFDEIPDAATNQASSTIAPNDATSTIHPEENAASVRLNMMEGGEPTTATPPIEANGGKLGSNGNLHSGSGGRKSSSSMLNPFMYLPFGGRIQDEWESVQEFLQPRQSFIHWYLKYVVLYLMVPLLGAAFILYYVFENPPTGKGNTDVTAEEASASWWVLFLVRNLVTFSLAKFAEILFVEYLCLNTRIMLTLFGPVFTLLVASSKGWPFIMTVWSALNLSMVVGTNPFARHWLYFQSTLDIFNTTNPSGNITLSNPFHSFLLVAVGVGSTVSLKRLLIGLYLGRKTFSDFAEKLSQVLDKMLLITEVAILARDIEKRVWAQEAYERESRRVSVYGYNIPVFPANPELMYQGPKISDQDMAKVNELTSAEAIDETAEVGDTVTEISGFQKIVGGDAELTAADKAKIAQLLGQWEDPNINNGSKIKSISVGSVLQFRRALARMDTDFPFSTSFGIADTRENCVASSQDAFLRLILKSQDSNGLLPFETLAEIALNRRGELDIEKVKKLIQVFRPDRDGNMSLLEFARSIDEVYKKTRLLYATIHTSSQLDHALELIFNFFFYIVMGVIILFIFGFNPLALFVSSSTVLLSFRFVFGSASSGYMEGLLLILVQRPYGIGDRVNVSNPNAESPNSGAQGWIVQKVTLFTTTVVLAASNEVATVANGALARSRIVNAGRSTKAVVFFTLKFGLATTYEKLEIFKNALEKFVHGRPREWISLLAFRTTRVESDLGFIEYICVLQHRERWQSVGAINQSKAIVQQFSLELQKKMKMNFTLPPRPVDLRFMGTISDDRSFPPTTPDLDPNSLDMTSLVGRERRESQDVSASVFALFGDVAD